MGGAGGFYYGRNWGLALAKKKADVGFLNYKQTLGARLDKELGQDDITKLMSNEHVKNAFSPKDVKMLYSVLPKWELTIWEFKAALKKLETAKLTYKIPSAIKDPLNKGRAILHKPALRVEGAEKHHKEGKISDDMALRIFQMFDLSGNGKINANEIITVLAIFSDGDDKSKAELLFDVWDYDGDGIITRKEMREAYKKMNKGQAIAGSVPAARVFTSAFFNICDQNKDGKVTKEEFLAKYQDKYGSTLTKLLADDHYLKFLNKEDFPEMARCFTEAYQEARTR